MLKYLLGIVTALIFVAAFIVWTTMQDDAGTGSATGNDEGTSAPAPAGDGIAPAGDGTASADDNAAPSGDGAAPAGDGSGSDGKATEGSSLSPPPNSDGETRGITAGAIADAPMRREVIPTLGFAIDVPEAWIKLDASGMRRYFSQSLGMTDQQQVDALVSGIVLATIRTWPENSAVANVIINHKLDERRDVLQVLNTMLENKRSAYESVDVIAPPTQGQLGPFWGGSLRTRDMTTEDGATTIRDAVIWILRVGDGYMLITAEAPTNDEEGQALIERMLESVTGARDSG